MPQEDPTLTRLEATASMSRLDTTVARSSSALEGGFGRHTGLGAGAGRRIPKVISTTAAVDDDVRNSLPVGTGGQRTSLGRPWTTGGFVGGSRPTAPAVATEGLGTERVVNDHHHGRTFAQMNGAATAAATAAEDGGHRRGGREVRPNPRRRRPQTAKELGKRRSAADPEDSETFQARRNASWQPVWESLQTARLISSPRIFQAKTASVGTTEEVVVRDSKPEGDTIFERRIGGVDFGRQRRARTTARAARGQDTADYLHESSDSACSAPEGEAGSSGGDGSWEVGDRAQIKKRASDFTSTANPASGVGSTSCPLSAGRTIDSPSPSSPSGPGGGKAAASTSTRGGDGQTHYVKPQQSETFSNSRIVPPQKSRRSRRSLTAMDDDTCSSSSEGEGKGHRKQQPGNGDRSNCGDGLGGVSVCAESDGRKGGGISPRRVSSIHASRMLGFDLRKSLAAIDEWTDKATTTVINSGGCASSPRQRAAKAGEEHQPAPFFIEHTAATSGLSPVSPPAGASNKDVQRATQRAPPLNETVASVLVAGAQQPPIIRRKKRIWPSTRVGMLIDNNSDGGYGSGDDDEDDDGEAVLSIAAARAALGISKVATTAAAAATAAGSNWSSRGAPSLAEIDAITGKANDFTGRKGTMTTTTSTDNRRKQRRTSSKGKEGEGSIRRAGSASATTAATATKGALPGIAVGMSDEILKYMLKQQPRRVPELRTKESFRDFFQGMEAERMDRLLRGAYEESLPADQVDKKVKKRLGLVGDILAW